MAEPTHGFTRDGKPVHGRITDHLPVHNWYARVNKKVAVWLTDKVGSMTCYWIFSLIALISFPAVLVQVFSHLGTVFPHWMTAASLVTLIIWVSSNYLQLTLLPAIMVGQGLQSAAADVRSTKSFEDTEKILNLMDTKTEGGLKVLADKDQAILDAIAALQALLAERP